MTYTEKNQRTKWQIFNKKKRQERSLFAMLQSGKNRSYRKKIFKQYCFHEVEWLSRTMTYLALLSTFGKIKQYCPFLKHGRRGARGMYYYSTVLTNEANRERCCDLTNPSDKVRIFSFQIYAPLLWHSLCDYVNVSLTRNYCASGYWDN